MLAHHPELIRQLGDVVELESVVQEINQGIVEVVDCAARLRADIGTPYGAICVQTRTLERVYETTSLVRAVAQYCSLANRLRGDLERSDVLVGLPRAAASLQELDELCASISLEGVDVVTEQRGFVIQARGTVSSAASQLLSEGIASREQARVGAAMQVFSNMRQLEGTLKALVSGAQSRAAKAVRHALDSAAVSVQAKNAGGAGSAGAGDRSGAWTSTLFQRLDDGLGIVREAVLDIWLVQLVLWKKQAQSSFGERLAEGATLFSRMWQALVPRLADEFGHAATASKQVHSALTGSYPKLLRALGDVVRALQVELATSGSGHEAPAPGSLVESAAPFAQAYLELVQARLAEPASLCFGPKQKGLPGPAQVRGVVSAVQVELESASVDVGLMQRVAGAAGFMVGQLSEAGRGMLSMGPDAVRLVTGEALSAAQKRNVAVCNALMQISAGLSELVQPLPGQVGEALGNALRAPNDVASSCLDMLVEAVEGLVERTTNKMHKNNFSDSAPAQDGTPTMQELAGLLGHVSSALFQKFWRGELVLARVADLASYTSWSFVRQVCLVRPLSEAGKLVLAADVTHAELAVQSLLSDHGLSAGGSAAETASVRAALAALRALKPMLLASDASLHADEHGLLGALPASCIALHLFARAPEGVPQPGAVAGWNTLQYARWMAKHSEREILLSLRRAQDEYVGLVAQRGEKHFDPSMVALTRFVDAALGKS